MVLAGREAIVHAQRHQRRDVLEAEAATELVDVEAIDDEDVAACRQIEARRLDAGA